LCLPFRIARYRRIGMVLRKMPPRFDVVKARRFANEDVDVLQRCINRLMDDAGNLARQRPLLLLGTPLANVALDDRLCFLLLVA